MKKQHKIILGAILGIVLILAIVGTVYYVTGKSLPAIGLTGLFDKYGKPISGIQQAVVGTTSGVRYITVGINVLNKDTTPLNFKILSASPPAFAAALPVSVTSSADPNAYANWNSQQIDITPFIGTTQTFSVTIDASSPLRQNANKTVTMTLTVSPDPVSNFDATLTSSVNGTGSTSPVINPSCTESWSCGTWSTCSASSQSRTCTDANACGTTTNKPATTQSCTLAGLIAVSAGGGYTSTAAYVTYNGVTYHGTGSMTTALSNTLGSTIIGTTPENFNVFIRSNNPNNVYVQVSQSNSAVLA